MGSFLADIEGKQITIDQQLLNASYSKIVQYYSSYKSICQGYTINIPEYTHIFGPNQLSFQVWEGKHRGRIDAIEMFTGLIVFSSIGFEQKIKFLFEMFDFNEEGFLYYENVALMLVNACNASYKVYSIPKSVLYEGIEEFLDEYFTQQTQISFQKLLRWTHRVPELGEYFRLIGHDIDQVEEEKIIEKMAREQCEDLLDQRKKVYFSLEPIQLDRKFFHQLEATFQKNSPDLDGEALNLQLEWIYGINGGKQKIKYICSEGMKAANEKIIYSVGRVIIIYFPKLNAQYYYKEHVQNISVIEISQYQRLVASAQEGQHPELHIWDLKNRNLLVKFKQLHKQTIEFIKFFKNDRQLIATSRNSIQGNSPIIILNLPTQQIIMSTYLQYSLLGLAFSQELQARYSGLLVLGTKQIAFFSQQKDSYQIYSEKIKTDEQIRAFAHSKQGMFVSAHVGRKLYYWDEQFQPHSILIEGSNLQIEEMLWLDDKLCLMDQQDIEILWFEKMEVLRAYKVNIRTKESFSGNFLHMEGIGEDSILMLTNFGDVVKICQLNLFENPRVQKYYTFFKIVDPKDYLIEDNGKMMIIGGSLLYIVDKYEKELCGLLKYEWGLEKAVTGKDCLLLLGKVDQKTKIIMSLHPKDYKIKEMFKINCRVGSMILLHSFLLFFSQNTLTVFHRQEGKFFEKKPMVHTFQFGCPHSVVSTLDPDIFIIFNQFQQIIRVNFSGMNQVQFKKMESKALYSLYNRLSACYASAKHDYPFCCCLTQKIFAVSQNNGNILLWNSISQALSDEHSALTISYHTGKISKLILFQNQLVSLGLQDGMMIIMKHRSYKKTPQNDSFIIDEFSRSQKMNLTQQLVEAPVRSERQTIFTQLNVNQIGGAYLKQSEVDLFPLAESQNSDLKKIIKEIINPKNKAIYEPLIIEGVSLGSTKVNLQIEAINGFSSCIPHGLYYRHSYNQEPTQLISFPNQQNPQMQQGGSVEDFRFSKSLLFPLDDVHLGCTKQFLYTADRLCILRSSKENKQKIYGYHRRRVTCLAIHPDRQMVASCEESASYPVIHLWDAQQMYNRAVISTRHQFIITRIAFSREGQWLVTLGGSDGQQSIQVTSWRDNEEIVFKLLRGYIFRQVLFDPYDRRQLSVVGEKTIQVFRNQSGILVLIDECKVCHDICSMTYTSSIYGNTVESDLVVGTTQGSIGIFICGQFILSKEQAHSSAIICLRLAELFGYKRVLISGGLEGVVKIWDIKFHELSAKDIREEIYSFKLNSDEKPQCSITSLDVYQCLKSNSTSKPSTLLLIGCSDGSVLEATIHNESQGNYLKSHITQETQKLKEKINFDISLLYSAPPNLSQTKFQIYRNFMITYNSKASYLQIWNLNTSQRLLTFELPHPPILLCCMNNRPVIMVSYQKEADYLSLLELVFENSVLKGIQQVGDITNIKGFGQSVLSSFSSKDDRLAMIFNNQMGFYLYLFICQGNNYDFSYRCKIDVGGPVSFIEFSSNGEGVLMGVTYFKGSNPADLEYIIKCYRYNVQKDKQKDSSREGEKQRLEQFSDLSKFDFRRVDFTKIIRANYIECKQLVSSQQQVLTKSNIKVTSMAQFDKYLLLGTVNGEILIVESSFFMKRSSEPKIQIRNYVITDSAITGLVVRENRLFISSEKGQGVIQAKLKLEDSWEFKQIPKDKYSEHLSVDRLQERLKNVYEKRKNVLTKEQVDDSGEGVHLKLSAVIGRNAVYKRNNIFVDLKDSIISFSGCNILIMKRYPEKKLEQIRVKPDPTPNSNHPEISAMTLGDCKRLLVVGTTQQQCQLLFWNISTHTYLFKIHFPGFVSVNIIKLSLSNKHAAVVAMSKSTKKSLLFIDLQNRKIIGVFRLIEISLNDICFSQGQQYRVLGCGPNYMGEWTFNNGILNAKQYSLGDHQDLHDLKNSGIIFYSLIFLQNMAISSGSDGYLYIWKQGQLAKRQNAHPGHQVLSLYAATNSKIFASGGTNGRVVIWKVWSSLIIQHQGQYPSKEGNLKFPIQGISMTRESLVVGDTSGAIIQFGFGNQDGSGFQNLLAPFDHQIINSCAFSTSSKRLYVLTDAQQWGTFAIFDTHTFEKVRQERIDFKGSSLIRMLVCRLSNKIFFIMKNSIIGNILQSEPKDERSKILKAKWQLKCPEGIKTAALSSRENYLAVLIMQSKEHGSRIQIYNLDVPHQQFYASYAVEKNISTSIDLIDFCIDHDYLFYQGPEQEQTIIDLMNMERLKASQIESQLEWNQQAKKTSPAFTEITSTFSDESRLLRLVHVMNKCLVATEQNGNIRVFREPFSNKIVPSQICSEHLNEVYICVVSPDSKLLVTVSRQDRAMHFWELTEK